LTLLDTVNLQMLFFNEGNILSNPIYLIIEAYQNLELKDERENQVNTNEVWML